MAKVLGLKQLLQKKSRVLEGLSPQIIDCFGQLVEGFIMIIWGQSGNGKSEFVMQILKELVRYGKILYVGLEEGHSDSMQQRVIRNLSLDEHNGKIEFSDHEMTYPKLMEKLAKKKSPKTIVIDSLQYWNISYEEYKALKERFPRKNLIFISHAAGKYPDGRTADKVRYDAGIKVRVDKFIAFITSRYGGTMNYVIYEERAKKQWGARDFKKQLKRQ